MPGGNGELASTAVPACWPPFRRGARQRGGGGGGGTPVLRWRIVAVCDLARLRPRGRAGLECSNAALDRCPGSYLEASLHRRRRRGLGAARRDEDTRGSAHGGARLKMPAVNPEKHLEHGRTRHEEKRIFARRRSTHRCCGLPAQRFCPKDLP